MSPRTVAVRRGLPPAAAGIPAPADRRFRRADFKPARRRRLAQLALRIGRVAAMAGVVLVAVSWGTSVVLSSSMLQVSHLVVRGNARLSVAEVETLLDGIRNENIFRVDFEQYRRRLMDSPWVERVALWRVLPSTVEVRVIERSPMVIARVGSQLYLVDEQGVIIDEFGPQYHQFDLPIVDGLITPSSGRGALVAPERIRLVEALVRSLEAHPDLRQRLSQVDVSNPRNAIVLLDGDPVVLHLGDTRFAERLRVYLDLAPTLGERIANIDYVDLRFDERIYVGKLDKKSSR